MVSEPDQDRAGHAYRHGIALHRDGRIDAAESCYRLSLIIDPAQPGSLQLLGVAAYQGGRAADGAALIRRAIAIDSTVGEFHNNLAAALLDLEEYTAAGAAARRAVVLKPEQSDAYVNLGAATRESGDLQQALSIQERALRIRITPQALNDLSAALRLDGHHDAALRHCRAALICAPDKEKTYNNLALILMDLGRPEAYRQMTRSLLIRPSIKALRTVTELATITPGDPWFEHIKAIEASPDGRALTAPARIALKFALAKGYGDLGDKPRAFSYLLEGNRLKRTETDYDEATELALLGRVRDTFSASLVARRPTASNPSDQPIFIVGLPRSGTTLVEQVLASHPWVIGAGESPFLFATIDRVLTRQGLDYPESLATPAGSALAAAIGEGYLAAAADLTHGAAHFTDKLPGNLLNVGLIRAALPNAKIVLVRRDPIDVALSCFSKLFSGGLNYTYDLGELGRYIRASLDLMDHWEAVLPPPAMLTLCYEALVEDFAVQARRLLDYCNLPWDDRVLTFHRTERAVRTASVNQVRQPLYRSSVGRWRPDSAVLEPLLAALR